MQPNPTARAESPVRSFAAWVLAASVLLLSLLAVAPVAHNWVHDLCGAHGESHASTEKDPGCGIDLFGQGVTTSDATPVATAPECIMRGATQSPPATVWVADPAYRLLPACGPPGIGLSPAV